MAKSREFCYLDRDGKRQDAALHDPILASARADKIARAVTRKMLMTRFGYTAKEADALLG